MRITKFEAENFKRLKAVDITPDDNTVVIAGRNAQGKTSVLDGIMAALAGRSGSKELVRPIRDGESRARVLVELDDLVVERKWTPSGSTVTVGPKGGNSRLNSPQAVLDKLIGTLSFDPLAFAEAEPKKQVSILIDLIGRDKFEQIANERRDAFENRTDVNRQVKSIRARFEAIGRVEKIEPVDQDALSREYGAAREKMALRDRWIRAKAELDEIEARVKELPQTRDIETVDSLLTNAVKINDQARRYDDSQALAEELEQGEAEAERLTSLIALADQGRTDLIASAALPVEGLAFDDDGVEFNGVPFIQASAAERLKVSVGMAMALNPELRVICIRDASLLDADSKNALIALAVEHDFQIWYEVVGDGGSVGVVIEDGQVQA